MWTDQETWCWNRSSASSGWRQRVTAEWWRRVQASASSPPLHQGRAHHQGPIDINHPCRPIVCCFLLIIILCLSSSSSCFFFLNVWNYERKLPFAFVSNDDVDLKVHSFSRSSAFLFLLMIFTTGNSQGPNSVGDQPDVKITGRLSYQNW